MMRSSKEPIRVLVVDDSALVRLALTRLLQEEGDIEVVGTASNGREALEQVQRLRPQVVITDLIMPEMDGVAFIRAQMQQEPLPILVASVLSETSEQTLDALEAGALDFVRKPTSGRFREIGREMRTKVRYAARVSHQALQRLAHQGLAAPAGQRGWSGTGSSARGKVSLVAIAASTGGPQALRTVLRALPPHFPAPVVVVQHIPKGYTAPLARRLDRVSPLEVVEAAEGLPLKPGRAVVARAGWHLKFRRRDGEVLCHLDTEPSNTLHRPSADVVFASAAQVCPGPVLAVVLTGMGKDGVAGAAEVKAHGGRVIAESSSTAVVYGMPRAVQEAGLADWVVPLDKIAKMLVKYMTP